MNDDIVDARSLAYLQETLTTPLSENFTVNEGEPLFQACSKVAEKMGFSLPQPLQEKLTMEEISRLGQFRYRNIELKANWWKQDHGHFIGFYKDEKRPVAVIFFKHKEYRFFNPDKQRYEKVHEKNASLFSTQAIALYPPFPSEAKTIRGIFSLIFSKIQWEYTAIFFIGIFAVILSFAFPITNKILFDFVIPSYNYNVYTQLFIGLFIVTLAATAFSFNRYLLSIRIKGILTNKIQIALWDRLLRLPITFFRSFAGGDLLNRTFIFEEVKDRFSDSALSILLNGFFSIFYVAIMFYFSWELTLISIALIILWGGFAFAILYIKIRYEKQMLVTNAKIQSFLVQVIEAINKVRTTCIENRLFSKWAKDFSRNQSFALKALNLKNMIIVSTTFMSLLLPFTFFSFVIYMKAESGGKEMLIQTISVGSFLAFLAAFTPFSQGLLHVVDTITSLTEIVPFWKRAQPLLVSAPETTDIGADPGVLQGNIEVNNLQFRYETSGPLILKGVNLTLRPGELIGLVGKTGSGKSTICRVLFGFEKVSSHSIFFDGQDINDLNLFNLRKQIGFIFQENRIFNGSIYENLTCNRPVSKQWLDQVLTLTCFDQDLEELPMGLDTHLSSLEGLLSGGQKQKLLLARALLTNPQILLIDEGLNTLDSQTQAKVLKNIKLLGKTTLLTSHRLNVLEFADQIYVIDGGAMAAKGTFQQLAEQEGIFKQFLQRQIFPS